MREILRDLFQATLYGWRIFSHSPKLNIMQKSGLALSKCYKVIDRFSEGVDLGVEAAKTIEGQRRKLKYSIVDAAHALGLEISNVDETRSCRSFNRYFVPLPSDSSSRNELLVETALMTPVSPTNKRDRSPINLPFVCGERPGICPKIAPSTSIAVPIRKQVSCLSF